MKECDIFTFYTFSGGPDPRTRRIYAAAHSQGGVSLDAFFGFSQQAPAADQSSMHTQLYRPTLVQINTVQKIETRKLDTANRSRVSIRGRS